MQVSEAKEFLGRQCAVTYRDRRGNQITKTLHIHDITFVPLYGAYLIGDSEDVSLEKVVSIDVL